MVPAKSPLAPAMLVRVRAAPVAATVVSKVIVIDSPAARSTPRFQSRSMAVVPQSAIGAEGVGSRAIGAAPGNVTIAEAAPRNLVHFVAENGCYEANGSHPIPGQNRVDFAGLARSAGYAKVYEFDLSLADGINEIAAKVSALDGSDKAACTKAVKEVTKLVDKVEEYFGKREEILRKG